MSKSGPRTMSWRQFWPTGEPLPHELPSPPETKITPDEQRERIGIVACCKAKRDKAMPAQDLYDSPLFHKSVQYVTARCKRWLILSAKLGVVLPDQVIEPYDRTLSGSRRWEIREWQQIVGKRLREQFPETYGVEATAKFIVVAGANYCGAVEQSGCDFEAPFKGLGIGQLLAALTKNNQGGHCAKREEPEMA
jgi:hypothetical protein